MTKVLSTKVVDGNQGIARDLLRFERSSKNE
jgi:hypothetical protein